MEDVCEDYRARLEVNPADKWVAYGLALSLVALDNPAEEDETIKALNYALKVCVCACTCVRLCARARACVRVRACSCVHVRVRGCVCP